MATAAAGFYNRKAVRGQTREARQFSPIADVRAVNNWVKACLIQDTLPPGDHPLRVLDLCGGQGGDLSKWERVDHLTAYTLVDSSADSVKAARERYQGMRQRFPCTPEFVVADMCEPGLRGRVYDVVSCQFALHYAFESEHKARAVLHHVASLLRPGGVFLVTIPNAERLRAFRVNPYCRIDWATPSTYSFWLADAIDGVPEYVVPAADLVRYAAEAGLELSKHESFHDFVSVHLRQNRFVALLQRMRQGKEEDVTSTEWEIIDLYDVYVFTRV